MVRVLVVAALCLVAACSFDESGVPLVGADAFQDPTIDAATGADARVGPDASPPDACGDSCITIEPSNDVGPDQLTGVTQGLVFGAATISTINSDDGQIVTGGTIIVRGPGGGVVDGIRFQQLSDSIAVIGVDAMTVGQDAYVRVVGSRALIILSAGDVMINGAIDVSGGCVGGGVTCGGPGAGNGTPDEAIAATGCAPGGNGGGGVGIPPETGGGGGGFGASGAAGGSDGASDPGGVGGALPGSCSGATLVPLMGGSGGGSGGIDNCGGDGGGGGGGLQLTSYTRIDIVGPGMMGRPVGINAAGAGGRGGEASDGGGGGGSGGGILVEALVINISDAILAANGGGGGGGGDVPTTATGESGTFGTAQAVGGSGGTRTGGAGGSILGAAVTGQGGGDNTGGGGGGVGIIRLNVPEAGLSLNGSAETSPMFTRGDPAIK